MISAYPHVDTVSAVAPSTTTSTTTVRFFTALLVVPSHWTPLLCITALPGLLPSPTSFAYLQMARYWSSYSDPDPDQNRDDWD